VNASMKAPSISVAALCRHHGARPRMKFWFARERSRLELARSASKLLEEVHGEERALELVEAVCAKKPADEMKCRDTSALILKSRSRNGSFHPLVLFAIKEERTLLRHSSTAGAA